MAKTDWVPGTEQKLAAMLRLIFDALGMALNDESRVKTWEWKPTLGARFHKAIEAYFAALAAWEADSTPALLAAKNALKDAVVDELRMFVASEVRYNPLMTEADRESIGLRPTDHVPTVHQRPTDASTIRVDYTHTKHQHRVQAVNPDGGKGKPAQVHGVHFGWREGGDAPATGAALTEGQFSRRPDIIVTFAETAAGKPVWYAARYENAKGEAGPWSDVVKAYIS